MVPRVACNLALSQTRLCPSSVSCSSYFQRRLSIQISCGNIYPLYFKQIVHYKQECNVPASHTWGTQQMNILSQLWKGKTQPGMKKVILLTCLLEPLISSHTYTIFFKEMINLCFTSGFIDYQRVCKNYSSCLARGEAKPVTWTSAQALLFYCF